MMGLWRLAGISAISLILHGCGGDTEDTTTATTTPAAKGKTIAELAVETKDLSTLVAALTAADLVSVFNGTDDFTVFAPVNDAFAALPSSLLDCLLAPAGIPTLTDVLKYHVVSGSTTSSDLKAGSLKTLDGDEELTIKIDGSTVMVDNATVTTADVMASNGVVHLIDMVLIPSNFMAPDCGSGTLAALVAGTTDLSTLLTALTAAELVDTFNATTGPAYTVFAPTNEAFSSVASDVLDCLLKPENKESLTNVLTNHVVEKYLLAAGITDGLTEDSLDKETLTFTVKGGTVTINKVAKVTAADNFASNGVAHVIDQVLVPSNLGNCSSSVFGI